MVDFLTDGDELTPEELVILGKEQEEAEPENSETSLDGGVKTEEELEEGVEEELEEGEEPEEEPGEEPEEGEDPEEGEEADSSEPIPYKRFSKVNGQRKDLERENKELRRQVEGINKRETEPQEKDGTFSDQTEDVGSLTLSDPDSEYHGLSLNEIYEENPVLATKLQTDYYEAQRVEKLNAEKEAQSTADSNARYVEGLRQELESFEASEANRLYNKNLEDLSKKERVDVEVVMQNVLDYMGENSKRFATMEDAYIVMNSTNDGRARAFKDIKGKIKDFEGAPSSMGSTGGGSDGNSRGYSLDLTRNQVADMINKMPDNKYVAWRAKAPAPFLKKFGLPQ